MAEFEEETSMVVFDERLQTLQNGITRRQQELHNVAETIARKAHSYTWKSQALKLVTAASTCQSTIRQLNSEWRKKIGSANQDDEREFRAAASELISIADQKLGQVQEDAAKLGVQYHTTGLRAFGQGVPRGCRSMRWFVGRRARRRRKGGEEKRCQRRRKGVRNQLHSQANRLANLHRPIYLLSQRVR